MKETIKQILEQAKDVIIVSSCGHISRFVYEQRQEDVICLTGSMGMTAAFSYGLALAKPDRRILALMGDGDYLMGFNALLNIQEIAPENLLHIVLDNNQYKSTGGQRISNFLYCLDWAEEIYYYHWLLLSVDLEFISLEDWLGVLFDEKAFSLGVIDIADNSSDTAPRIPDSELPYMVKLT